MKTIKIFSWSEIPDNYTGIVEWRSGAKSWHLNREQHREDGPAVEYPSGNKYWYLNGESYSEDEYRTEMMSRSSTLGKLLINNKTKLEDN